MINENYTSQELVDSLVEGALATKASRIVTLNLTKLSKRMANFFIICDAESNTQVNAIANTAEFFAKKNLGVRLDHKEGFENSQWVLLDYGDVVLHVFQTPFRSFYDLEGMWADAVFTSIEDEASTEMEE